MIFLRVVIDGRSIKSEQDLHRLLAEKLDFGPYYGYNLNALWDRLYRDVPGPVELIWTESEASKNALGAERFQVISKLLVEVMEDDLTKAPEERFTVRFE
ncbi:ribonuclease inhibitor [Amycolatopsis sulphurea]|uniref:Ribonuclease inhibitor n=1 Tax=Amycolatopsis sulphurea TaxID=76022 RepID=A0A2A9F6H1_9PSEU|nr:ribonuclease inhibitor [Amycolatopsis sulphurea]